MISAAAANVAVSDDGSDPYGLIVTDLIALIGHVRTSLQLIEAAIAREALLAEQDTASDICVLDDVTPRYAAASTALQACDIGLARALDRLCDATALARLLN